MSVRLYSFMDVYFLFLVLFHFNSGIVLITLINFEPEDSYLLLAAKTESYKPNR